jgi:hypothetical protein
MVSSLWKSMNSEIVLILERPLLYHRPCDMSRTPTGRRRSTIAASHVARTTPTGGMKPADIDRPIFRSD